MVSVLDYLSTLAQCKRFILICTLATAVVGVLYSLAIPPEYTATTKLMTPQETPSSAALLMTQFANNGAGALVAAAGGLGLRNPNDTYIGFLSSRPIADAIIQRFGLVAAYKAHDITSARKALAANTNVSSEKSGFISVTVKDNDKKRAAAIANAYTEELRNLTQALAVTEASQRRLFYEDQLKHAKDDLVQAEFTFQQIQQKKGLVSLDAQAKAAIESLTALHAQIAAKKVEVQALRSYSTDRNPSLQLAENELSSMQTEASLMEQRSHSAQPAVPGLQDLAGEGVEYLSAEHELQYRQILFDLLLKQYDAAKLDEAKEAAVIQVVERAIPPERKSAPHRALIVLIFVMLGFLGACGYLHLHDLEQRNPEVARSLGTLKAALLSR